MKWIPKIREANKNQSRIFYKIEIIIQRKKKPRMIILSIIVNLQNFCKLIGVKVFKKIQTIINKLYNYNNKIMK